MQGIDQTLLDRLRENEDIAKRFFEVEMDVLSTLNFCAFFDRLLSTIKDRFDIPYVWISMIKGTRVLGLIQTFTPDALLCNHLNIVENDRFTGLIGASQRPVLANMGLEGFRVLFPEGMRPDYGSVSITPLSFDGELTGSLNLADLSKARFQPGIDTSLLEQLGVVVSISLANVAAHEELRALAYRDTLTGLLNRRAMERILEREMGRAIRYGSKLSLVFIDLDAFKKINDTLGHDAGDEVLEYVAKQLEKMCRQSDVAARYAGDEFVLILPGTDHAEAADLMGRIQEHFHQRPFGYGSSRIQIKLSHGIASVSRSGPMDAQALLKQADERLYLEKNSKKGEH